MSFLCPSVFTCVSFIDRSSDAISIVSAALNNLRKIFPSIVIKHACLYKPRSIWKKWYKISCFKIKNRTHVLENTLYRISVLTFAALLADSKLFFEVELGIWFLSEKLHFKKWPFEAASNQISKKRMLSAKVPHRKDWHIKKYRPFFEWSNFCSISFILT